MGVKVNYLNFTDQLVEDFDNNEGLYIGFEVYSAIAPNIYLGAEIGYANPTGTIYSEWERIHTEVTFVPLELNLKYAVQTSPGLVIDFGAGISSNYVEEEERVFGYFGHGSRDDWLFGGQFFMDVNFTMQQFFIGLNAKYQATEDFRDYNYNYNNWRIGGQIGLIF